MSKSLIARASTTIDAPIADVWDALVNPSKIKKYMFGTEMISGWKEGDSIVWKGEWQGKSYEDKGTILKIEKEKVLRYNHFSPIMGKPDLPENYHTVTIEVSGDAAHTTVSLAQDNNDTEEARQHSQKNWEMMLQELKKFLEE